MGKPNYYASNASPMWTPNWCYKWCKMWPQHSWNEPAWCLWQIDFLEYSNKSYNTHSHHGFSRLDVEKQLLYREFPGLEGWFDDHHWAKSILVRYDVHIGSTKIIKKKLQWIVVALKRFRVAKCLIETTVWRVNIRHFGQHQVGTNHENEIGQKLTMRFHERFKGPWKNYDLGCMDYLENSSLPGSLYEFTHLAKSYDLR